MKRVTGLGGVFFRANDPKALAAWYAQHLDLPVEDGGEFAILPWRRADTGADASTVWATFAQDSPYFGSPKQACMLNYRVDDLDGVLAALQSEGVEIVPDRQESADGRFAWIVDPEGNRVELWEPPK
jgi:predicted enzyme related to lactoylglutathione lyase